MSQYEKEFEKWIATTHWIDWLRQSKHFGHLCFKCLRIKKYGTYPPINIPNGLLDWVSLKEFVTIEEERIPLFVSLGNVGTTHKSDKISGFYDKPRKIAVLNKNSYSHDDSLNGGVTDVTLYRTPKNGHIYSKETKKLFTFKNEALRKGDVSMQDKKREFQNHMYFEWMAIMNKEIPPEQIRTEYLRKIWAGGK